MMTHEKWHEVMTREKWHDMTAPEKRYGMTALAVRTDTPRAFSSRESRHLCSDASVKCLRKKFAIIPKACYTKQAPKKPGDMISRSGAVR